MKINVAWTVADTVRFVLTRLHSIVRIGWLPGALALVVSDAMADIDEWAMPRDEFLIRAVAISIGVGVQLLASIVIVLGYLRLSFGRESEEPAIGYFHVGRPEFLYFGVYVLLLLGVGFLGLGFWVLLDTGMALDVMIVVLALVVVAYCWIWLRLTLQPAVILLEGVFGLARSWRLSRGNVIRFAAAILIGLTPIWAADLGLYNVVAGTWPQIELREPLAALETLFTWQSATASSHPLQTFGIDLAIGTLQHAVVAGVIAASYRQLTAEP